MSCILVHRNLQSVQGNREQKIYTRRVAYGRQGRPFGSEYTLECAICVAGGTRNFTNALMLTSYITMITYYTPTAPSPTLATSCPVFMLQKLETLRVATLQYSTIQYYCCRNRSALLILHVTVVFTALAWLCRVEHDQHGELRSCQEPYIALLVIGAHKKIPAVHAHHGTPRGPTMTINSYYL